jgi:hypothetical protein
VTLVLLFWLAWPDLFDPWSWSRHTLGVLTALGTAGAVIALVVVETTKGIFRRTRERRTRPLLSVSHDAKVDITREEGPHPQNANDLRQIGYVRLGISNAGGRRAAVAVEVTIKRLEQLHGEPNPKLPAHNVGPLGWTHRAPPFGQFAPGVRRTVALGAQWADDERIWLGVIPEPNSRVHIIGAGSHRITLTVSAANVDAEDWMLTLWHDGKLTAESDFGDHLKITDGPRRIKAVG